MDRPPIPKCKFCGAEMTFISYAGRIDEERFKFKCPKCHAELAEVQEYAYSPKSLFAPVGEHMELTRVKTSQYEEWEK